MFKEIIVKIAQKLEVAHISYMIIGGQAVLLYGEPRLTRDIDITLGTGVEKLHDILDIAHSISLKPLIENIDAFVNRTMVLPTIDVESGIRVDFIFSYTFYESQAIKRAKGILLENTEVFFATPEDVIIHKIFAARARDIEDVKSIMLKQKVNVDYIKKWLLEFDKSFPEGNFTALFKKLLKETRE